MDPRDQDNAKTLRIRFRDIRKHLKVCVEEHGNRCNVPVALADKGFQVFLIDIKRMCLVKKRISECGFLALSYVWGGVDQYEHTSDRTASLLEEGSLQKVFDQLPGTIRECIELVRQLRGYFLWVDSLCIIQDDRNLKEIHIARMAEIYSSAFLTIAAADAIDANSELPCIHRYDTAEKVLPEHSGSLHEHPKLSSVLQSTKYCSRAWTFQERFLSVRCLYTIRNQVFLRCHSGLWGKGSLFTGWTLQTEAPTYEPILSTEIEMTDERRLFLRPFRGDFFSIYWRNLQDLPVPRMVERIIFSDDVDRYLLSCKSSMATWALIVVLYTRKCLSFSSDVSHAFAGVAERLEDITNSQLTCGIPLTSLPHALLWLNNKVPGKRRECHIPIPSWSWMGWDGPIGFPMYTQTATGPKRMSADVPFSTMPCDDATIEEQHQSCIHSISLVNSKGVVPIAHLEPTEAPPESLTSFRSPNDASPQSGMPSTAPKNLPHVTGGLLIFESSTVQLQPGHLGYSPQVFEHEPSKYVIVLLQRTVTSQPEGVLLGVELDTLQAHWETTLVELVLLTRTGSFGGSKPAVNFLVVHWLNGYAERLGIGQATVDGWESWNPQPKTIILG